MNRCCLWLCTLSAASAAAVSDARAFHLHGAGTWSIAHLAAGPELHGPGPGAPAGAIMPPAPPSGNYNFSGNSFNLSVTRNGHPPAPGTPPPPPRGLSGGGGRPGFFQRMFNWW